MTVLSISLSIEFQNSDFEFSKKKAVFRAPLGEKKGEQRISTRDTSRARLIPSSQQPCP